MYFHSVIIVLFCVTNLSICAPIDEEDVQLLDMYQSRREDASEFMYKLSDGQKREEKIRLDNLDRGIAIRGSYNIELENGEMQTIYYISDNKGHRISINVPFPEDEIIHRPPPTRKPQNHEEAHKKQQAEIDERFKSFEQNRIDEIQRRGKVQKISQESDESKISNEKSSADSIKEDRLKTNRFKDAKNKIDKSKSDSSNTDKVNTNEENSKAGSDGKVEGEESKDLVGKSKLDSLRDQRFKFNRVKDGKIKSEISKDDDSVADKNNDEKVERSTIPFSRSRPETTTQRKIYETSEKPILLRQKIEHVRKIGKKTLGNSESDQENTTTEKNPELTTEKGQEIITQSEKVQEITTEKDLEITTQNEKDVEITSKESVKESEEEKLDYAIDDDEDDDQYN